MRYGLFMMPLHPPEKDPNRAYFDDIELLVRADELGFGEAWIGEHLTAQWESIPTPDLLIANVLPRTRQIKLGTGVACLPNHEPSMLAHRIAFLDHLAQGRFLFGIGSGGFPGDFEMYEVEPGRRAARPDPRSDRRHPETVDRAGARNLRGQALQIP